MHFYEASRTPPIRHNEKKSSSETSNLPIDERYFINGDYVPYESYRQTLDLLERNGRDIDVIVASNDCMALSAARAVSTMGFEVGVDIVNSGLHDTSEASSFFPGLTTVRQPLEKMGKSSVESLIEQINAYKKNNGASHLTTRKIVVNSELIERGSTQNANDQVSSEVALRPEEFHQ